MEIREALSYVLAIAIAYLVIGQLYGLVLLGIFLASFLANPGSIGYFLDSALFILAMAIGGIIVMIAAIYSGARCYRDKNIFYEIFRPSRKNGLLSLAVSLAFLCLTLISAAYVGNQGAIFMNTYTLEPMATIIGIPLSFVEYAIIFYPFSALCYFAYVKRKTIFNFTKKKAKIPPRMKVLIIALLIILNPFFVTLSGPFSVGLRYNILNEPCGVKYIGFTADSAARDAGMGLDEVIIRADGSEIKSTEDLSKVLEANQNKALSIFTDKGNTYTIIPRYDAFSGRYMIGIANVSMKFCPRNLSDW